MYPDPTLVFDGTDMVREENIDAYYSTFLQHFLIAKSTAPLYNLSLNGVVSTNSGTLHVKVMPADTLYHDSTNAVVVICQDSVQGMLGPQNWIASQFYTFPVSLFYPDSLDTTITFTHSIPVNKITGVLFMQDLNSKKVLQATKIKFSKD
jgi:hypothetical protein